MTSAIEQLLMQRMKESPYHKQKPSLSKVEDALLAQVEALKLFKPNASKGPDTQPLI